MRGAIFALAALAAGAAPAAAQMSDGVIRLGMLGDMTGLYADAGGPGNVEALRLAAEDFGGAVAGAPIDVVFADCQNRADVGTSIARRWYDQDGVDAVFDGCNSAVALAVQEITREKDRVAFWSGPGTSALTGRNCSPNGIHWTYDTYALGRAVAQGAVAAGARDWFFLTADYAFGHALERDATAFVASAGGRVVGGVRHPLGTSDFSSFLLQAQASGASAVGLANATSDTTNSIKQAAEFGLLDGTRRLVGLLVLLTDVHSLGLQTAQGLTLAETYYWDLDDGTRAFARRFEERIGRKPTMMQAGVYSAAVHYLESIRLAGTDAAGPVLADMRSRPVENAVTRGGRVREDGRMVADVHVFEVKPPEASRGPWDYYRLVRTIPGDQAYRPLSESDCPLVR
jgi:branched-chain amino acid transport system substrate-binding protein